MGAAAIKSGEFMLLSRRHSFPILTAAANTIPMKHAAMQDSYKTSCTSCLIILALCPLMICPRP